MLNFVLCDDNINILDKLKKTIESLFIEHNLEAEVSYSSNNPDNILKFVKENNVDVLILDINLHSSITGIELAEKIRENNKKIYIIFTTGHLEYAMLAYKVKTFDYLAKPITKERLEETILRLFDDIKSSPKKYIRVGNKNTLINLDDIYYIKKDGMKLIFQTKNNQYTTYSSFNKIQSCLPENFIRCHKSYITNIDNIENIKSNNIISFENNECYIGPKYKNNFMEVLNNGNFTNNLDSINNRK